MAMLISSCDGSEETDVFFDSSDRLSPGFGYEIWADEPRSVQERRRSFLQQMGFEQRLADPRDETVSSTSYCDEEESTTFEEEESNSTANFIQESNCESPVVIGQESGEFRAEESGDATKSSAAAAMRSWWRRLVKTRKEKRRHKTGASKAIIKVCRNEKRFLELTAPYFGQEIRAHEGFVWAMKFSPDGQYLASGGEDGVVRVWRVVTVEASSDNLAEGNLCSKSKGKKLGYFQRNKHPVHASVVFPDRVFRIDESPIQEFRGHSGDVLDLAWSCSNRILSSSMDKTVRLWQLGREESVNIFRHNDYVTCIEFNPVDENYFISGSIDGKVRIWGLSEERVVDWTDVRDLITAISYQPDGKGFIVGTITGTCRSYKTSGTKLLALQGECMVMESKINISGRKKTAGNKITGIKFSHDKPQRVMISSEDSKIRIFDGADLTHKYKGLTKSGSQTSASFTSTEGHIVSVGDDSRVYVWNYEPSRAVSSRQTTTRSVRSCEHFFHEGVSVAVPWPGMTTPQSRPQSQSRDSDRFSLGSWFSTDGPCTKGSATWPEEKLPIWDLPVDEEEEEEEDRNCLEQNRNRQVSEAWGLVIVAAGSDGTIRTLHNYGLPIRL